MRVPFPARLRRCALAACLVLPAGCDLLRDAALAPEVSRANAQMAAAKISCDAQFPAVRGSLLAHARCVDAAQNWVLRPLLPYPDLLSLSQSSRETLAAQADRGELDPGQLARLTVPEDAPLTLADATLRGPLTRWFPPAYYSPPPQPYSAKCIPRYGFSDCQN